MEKAEETMLENLLKNTGKSLEQWISIVKKANFEKHAEIIRFLKEEHAFTHGFANLVAMKARGADAGSVENKDELIEKQYKGKEHFRPLYENLMSEIGKFGTDIEIAPKIAYVSLRRKKQFATLQPTTKSRFEIGINLKGFPAKGKLEEIKSANAMCSHKINIAGENDIDKEVIEWLKMAYQNAV
ncbi:MAG: DUF4287 domain-containing protein [Bacteroidales bacterium]|nr:DUF4287 domain-containing protein [Bacteroidales bacterium]